MSESESREEKIWFNRQLTVMWSGCRIVVRTSASRNAGQTAQLPQPPVGNCLGCSSCRVRGLPMNPHRFHRACCCSIPGEDWWGWYGFAGGRSLWKCSTAGATRALHPTEGYPDSPEVGGCGGQGRRGRRPLRRIFPRGNTAAKQKRGGPQSAVLLFFVFFCSSGVMRYAPTGSNASSR